MTQVIGGGCTFSCAASSPGLIVPCRSSTASAANCVPQSPGRPRATRSARSRRARRAHRYPEHDARPASDLACYMVISISLSHYSC